MKKLLTAVLAFMLLIMVTNISTYTKIETKIFNQYNTLPRFEQYVTNNIEWRNEPYYLSDKPKTPEQTLNDKRGVCQDYAFLYTAYLKYTYDIDTKVIVFTYYKKSGRRGLHAIGLFKYNKVYWVTENWRIIRTKVPEDFTAIEFFNTYDIAWIYFKERLQSGKKLEQINNSKDRKELKNIAKHPNKTYRIKRSERYANGDFK